MKKLMLFLTASTFIGISSSAFAGHHYDKGDFEAIGCNSLVRLRHESTTEEVKAEIKDEITIKAQNALNEAMAPHKNLFSESMNDRGRYCTVGVKHELMNTQEGEGYGKLGHRLHSVEVNKTQGYTKLEYEMWEGNFCCDVTMKGSWRIFSEEGRKFFSDLYEKENLGEKESLGGAQGRYQDQDQYSDEEEGQYSDEDEGQYPVVQSYGRPQTVVVAIPQQLLAGGGRLVLGAAFYNYNN